jgi:hypothetical protein
VQPERGTYDRVLRSAQNSCDPYQRKNSHLPSRHGLCEGGVIGEAALGKLGLVDRSDPATMAVAKLIIEFAKAGERDPKQLCSLALQHLWQIRGC